MLRGPFLDREAEHGRVHAALAATTTVRLSGLNDAVNGNDLWSEPNGIYIY